MKTWPGAWIESNREISANICSTHTQKKMQWTSYALVVVFQFLGSCFSMLRDSKDDVQILQFPDILDNSIL